MISRLSSLRGMTRLTPQSLRTPLRLFSTDPMITRSSKTDLSQQLQSPPPQPAAKINPPVKKKKRISRVLKSRSAITVTPEATLRLASLLLSKPDINALGIRIGVKKRGCNGLSFTMNYVTVDGSGGTIGEGKVGKDEIISLLYDDVDGGSASEGDSDDGMIKMVKSSSALPLQSMTATPKAKKELKVYVDPAAIFNVVGTVMDWKEDEVSSEFVFVNPNSKGECGCGESFNV